MVSYMPDRKKNVLLISSSHMGAEVADTEAKKPQMIVDYNRTKSGVDTMDQMCR